MSPVGGGDAGDKVRDSGSVLRDTYSMLARDPRVSVPHVRSILFVLHADEPNASKPLIAVNLDWVAELFFWI